jgi:hypothetical protein
MSAIFAPAEPPSRDLGASKCRTSLCCVGGRWRSPGRYRQRPLRWVPASSGCETIEAALPSRDEYSSGGPAQPSGPAWRTPRRSPRGQYPPSRPGSAMLEVTQKRRRKGARLGDVVGSAYDVRPPAQRPWPLPKIETVVLQPSSPEIALCAQWRVQAFADVRARASRLRLDCWRSSQQIAVTR